MNTNRKKFNSKHITVLVIVVLFFIGGIFLGNQLFGLSLPYFGSTQSFSPARVTKQQAGDQLIVSLLDSGITIEMVFVPAGKFAMGSENEGPIHKVYLDDFWIDRTEVTNAQFAAFIEATGYTTTAEKRGESWVDDVSGINNADWKHPQGADSNLNGLDEHPVVHVSWYDAAAYCQWRDARLPTEAEWEKAARGVDGYLFPWGNLFDGELLNSCDINCPANWRDITINDKYARTAPVGSYPGGASPYGVLDMVGNVVEWVADWYAYDYYSVSPLTNPQGPTDDEMPRPSIFNHRLRGSKVIRGGSWVASERAASTNYRNTSYPDYSDNDLGFRCAYTPEHIRNGSP